MTKQQRIIANLPGRSPLRALGAPFNHYVPLPQLTAKGKRNRRDYYDRLWRELRQHQVNE